VQENDETPRIKWPEVAGFYRVTEAMEENQRCDRHPDTTYWECWMRHFQTRKIRVQAVNLKSAGRNWVAVYREGSKKALCEASG